MWQPFGNLTTTSTPLEVSWKSGPDERGTLSILISCIFTLILCLYQSLHLNIPKHGKSIWFPKLKSRVKWGVMGLLFPEYIVCIAIRQWIFARKFQRQMGKHLVSLPSLAKSDIEQNASYDNNEALATAESATHLKRFSWTKTHSQFALMGGFMFDTRGSRVNILPNGRTSLTLTSNALLKLAEHQPSIIPDISVDTIRDKSKADWLARLLVFIQLCWFMLKVIERLATRYPISLLELSTFIHALFCLLFYTAWWSKPFDIEEPHSIKIDTDLKRKVCAWMVMNSELGARKQVYHSTTSGNMWAYLKYVKDRKPTSAAEVLDQAEAHPNDAILQQHPDTNKAQKLLKLQLGQILHGFKLEFVQPSGNDKSSNACAYLTTDEIECIRLAKSLRESSTNAWKFEWSAETVDRKGMLTKQISLTASLDDDDLTADSNGSKRPLRLNCSSDFVFKVALGLSGSIYGGLHLFAWDAPFPTRTECWLWRISGIWIASFPMFGIIAAFEVLVSEILGNSTETRDWPVVRLLCRLGGSCSKGIEKTFVVYMIVWIIARFFLVAECFASLRQLPAAVYEEPEWTRLIPHFAAG